MSTVIETRAALESRVALYLGLIDDSIAEGDEESALELQTALETTCAKLEALGA